MKKKIIKKAVAKSKVNKNKVKITDQTDDLEEWTNENSLTSVEKNKCLMLFDIWPYSRDVLDDRLGIIAVLMYKGIMFNLDSPYIRPSDIVWENDETPEEIVFEYSKKDVNKIKEIEKAYHLGKIQIDPIKVLVNMIYIINTYFSIKGWYEHMKDKSKRHSSKKVSRKAKK